MYLMFSNNLINKNLQNLSITLSTKVLKIYINKIKF